MYNLLFIILCLFLAWKRWRIRKMVKLAAELKCDIPAIPLLGHSYMFIGNAEQRMETLKLFGRQAIKHDGLVKFWHANKLYLCIADPDVAEFVLNKCLEKDEIMTLSHLLLGNGLIFAPVPIWRPRRKVLTPTFSPKNFNNFLSILSKQSQIFVDVLEKSVGKGDFSIWNYATTFTMDSVCETTLGIQIGAQKNPNQPFLRALEELFHLSSARMCQPWLHKDFVYKMTPYYYLTIKYKNIVLDFINKIIENKRKSMREQKETKSNSNPYKDGLKSFLELLIESSGGDKGYTNLELQEETLVLVMAGTDTSAVAISYVTMMLSKHLDMQEKVYREIVEVFGDSDRSIEVHDLSKLRYMNAFVKETLRMYPPVPVILRTVEKDVTLPTGITLVEGCGVLINIWAVQRNPKYWGDDADRFRPERFIDAPPKHPAAFMAFSNGLRGCLGYKYAMMSIKIALTALLRRYRVLPAEGNIHEKLTDVPLRVKFDIMMRHVDDYMVQLELRK